MKFFLIFFIFISQISFGQMQNAFKTDLTLKKIYNQSKKANFIIDERYQNGSVKSLFIDCNCNIKDVKDSDQCIKKYYTFFLNGKLQEKGCQGFFNNTGVPVGTWEQYDLKGNLIKTTFYKNAEYGEDFILIKHYKNGKLVKKEKFNNYILYENVQHKIPY